MPSPEHDALIKAVGLMLAQQVTLPLIEQMKKSTKDICKAIDDVGYDDCDLVKAVEGIRDGEFLGDRVDDLAYSISSSIDDLVQVMKDARKEVVECNITARDYHHDPDNAFNVMKWSLKRIRDALEGKKKKHKDSESEGEVEAP